jgi:hypothetical protein
MGFFDDITGGIFENKRKGEDWEQIPKTENQKTAEKYLMDLLNRTVSFQPRQIAGPTEAERSAVSTAERVSAEGIPGLSEAVNQIREIMNAPIDVKSIPGLEGLFGQARKLGSELLGKSKRAMTLSGNRISDSSAGERVYGNTLQEIMDNFITAAYPFFQQFIGAKYNAPMNLANLATQEVTTPMAVGTSTGALPRQVKQAVMDAIFESLRKTKEFPYTAQAPIASNIMNQMAYMYDPGVISPSVFSQLAAAVPFSGSSNQPSQRSERWDTNKLPY